VEDVLGQGVSRQKLPRKWAEHHRNLTRLRAQFVGDMRNRTQNGRLPLSTSDEHMADGASDSYERDWALAMASSDQNALYEIDQALNRIAEGSYGICEITGKPIEAARLKTIPWTRFCASAQAELEARGISGRTQLGVLGTYAHAGDSEKADEEGDGAAELEREAA
jgi:RNA polymerase-binding transcription factor DksA